MNTNKPHTEEQSNDLEHKDTIDEQQATAGAEGAETFTDQAGEAADTPEVEVIEDGRFAELEKLAEENQQRYLRVQADFDNFRRRTVKEKEELGQYASMKLITQLLPIMDNFERAIVASQSSGDIDSLRKGVDMIFRQLEQVLEQEGLKPMETVGQPFNPEFHQAIMQVESEDHEEGIIVEEVQKGYVLKEKVLRPAMVKVSG